MMAAMTRECWPAAQLLFVRHGSIDGMRERLLGRGSGITLNADGEQEAAAVSTALAGVPLHAIRTSPQPRALQTAHAIATRHRCVVEQAMAFDEVDFGRWT